MLTIIPGLFVGPTKKMGHGVFTSVAIKAGSVVEESPVVVMTNDERKLIDQTLLHDYIFEWGDRKKQCCMALGYVPIYNHSFSSNCEYEMEFSKRIIRIVAMRDIKKGEELFINYNGTFNNKTPLWFNAE